MERTMFLDKTGRDICVDDVVRAPTKNLEVHGTWCKYKIKKAPGGYVMSYLTSEKGQIFPEGYTGGYMHDVLPDKDEHDTKTLIFTRVPLQVSQWEVL
jgi:hypothetical protein